MECEGAIILLSGIVDSVLGPIARFRVHRHVAGCNAFAARLEELGSMQLAIRTKLTYHRAPPGLAARIGAALPPAPAFRAGENKLPRSPVYSMRTRRDFLRTRKRRRPSCHARSSACFAANRDKPNKGTHR